MLSVDYHAPAKYRRFETIQAAAMKNFSVFVVNNNNNKMKSSSRVQTKSYVCVPAYARAIAMRLNVRAAASADIFTNKNKSNLSN